MGGDWATLIVRFRWRCSLDLSARAASHYVSPVSFAAIYSGLGDREQALTYLEQALEARDTSLPVKLLNPEFESLRREPRLQSLRQRIGLAAS